MSSYLDSCPHPVIFLNPEATPIKKVSKYVDPHQRGSSNSD